MKKIALTLFVFTLVLSSCKYEEGPGISLISKRDRISNEWSVINYKIDGNDNDSALKSFKSGDSLEMLLTISRSGYFSTNPQYTRAFSKANNNKLTGASKLMLLNVGVYSRGDRAARRGCCSRPNNCVRPTQNRRYFWDHARWMMCAARALRTQKKIQGVSGGVLGRGRESCCRG